MHLEYLYVYTCIYIYMFVDAFGYTSMLGFDAGPLAKQM